MRFHLRLAALAIAAASAAWTAQAVPITYTATLSGPAEDPPNASPGVGFAEVEFDLALHSLAVSASFSGLLGETAAAHIHCCTAAPLTGVAGVATQVPTFIGFPLGVSAGNYLQSFDTSLASTYNPAFVTANGGTPAGAEAALFAGLEAGRAYFNIHSNLFPGGEIRGFLVQEAPEPESLALLCGGLLALTALRRRKA